MVTQNAYMEIKKVINSINRDGDTSAPPFSRIYKLINQIFPDISIFSVCDIVIHIPLYFYLYSFWGTQLSN